MPIRVAVDAMGGDHAPAVVVEGAIAAVRDGDLEVVLFGPEARIREELARHDTDGLALSVVDAPEVIDMGESPTAAVKTKRRSSIHIGLQAHEEGRTDAFVTAGNTGAGMAASLFILGRIPGVVRPALIGFFPSPKGHCLVIDVGSNVDCKPEQMVQFAQMGALYAHHAMRHENPSVALLNIGEEPGKGNEQTKAAFDLLSAVEGLNFKGNIEGRDLFHHAADVVICDGFVGNVVLKLGESVATVLPVLIRQEIQRQGIDDATAALVSKVLKGVFARFNYEEYGGAPLVGVAGNVVIGHGGSSARAIKRMIEAGAELARQDLAGAIAAVFKDA